MASTGGVKGSVTNNSVSYQATTAIDAGYIVKQNTTTDNYVSKAAAATDKLFGVTISSASAADNPITIRTDGFARVIAGNIAGIARGNYVTSDAAGKALATSTATHIVIGIAEETFAQNEYGQIKLIKPVRYDSL